MLRKLTLSAVLGSILILFGCDYEFNEINPTYAVPLINSDLTVYDLLAKADSDQVQADPTGLVTVVYNNQLLQLPAQQLVTLNNQNFSTDAIYTGPSINPFPSGQSVQVQGTSNLSFSVPGVPEIYKLLLEKGNLNLTFTSNIKHHISYILTFEDVDVAGQQLVVSGASQYTGGTHNQSGSYTLDNSAIDLSVGNTTFNTLRVRYNVTITSAGNNPLNNGERLTFGMNINGMMFDQIDCYFGNQVIPIAMDSVDLNLFQFTNESQTPSGGTFGLTDPRITLKFTNSMTLPMNIDIQQLKLKQKPSGTVQDILLNNFTNPFAIAYPLMPGTPVVTKVEINNSNSNLRDLISPTKKCLIFQVDAITNPAGKAVNKINKNSTLDIEAGVELPLTGYGYNWVLGDTVALNLALNEQDNLKSGVIRLNMENRFPIDASLQVYFLDENYVLKDSLLNDPNFIKSGELDPNGRVIKSTPTQNDIAANNQKIRNITASKFVVLKAVLQTKDGQQKKDVKIYVDNFIRVQMGIKAELGYTF